MADFEVVNSYEYFHTPVCAKKQKMSGNKKIMHRKKVIERLIIVVHVLHGTETNMLLEQNGT